MYQSDQIQGKVRDRQSKDQRCGAAGDMKEGCHFRTTHIYSSGLQGVQSVPEIQDSPIQSGEVQFLPAVRERVVPDQPGAAALLDRH